MCDCNRPFIVPRIELKNGHAKVPFVIYEWTRIELKVGGRSKIPSRVTRPFFDSDLPLPFVTLTVPRVVARHAVFTAVRLLSVYFGLASRPIFVVRD